MIRSTSTPLATVASPPSPPSQRRLSKAPMLLSPTPQHTIEEEPYDACAAATIDFIPADVMSMSLHRARSGSRNSDRRVVMPPISPNTRRRSSSNSIKRASSATAIVGGNRRASLPRMSSASPSSPRLLFQPRPPTPLSAASTPSGSAKWESIVNAEMKNAKVQLEKMLTIGGFDICSTSEVEVDEIDDLASDLGKEHNVYQSILTNVSVKGTVEQAELISSVQEHYRQLFSRVPRRLAGLQRSLAQSTALNRQLVEEIVRVQQAMSCIVTDINRLLTADTVKPKSLKLTEQFSDTIVESESANKILRQLESLYDLQRQRMEKEVAELQSSCSEWISVAEKLCQRVANPRALAGKDDVVTCARGWWQGALKIVRSITTRDETCVANVEQTLSNWRYLLSSIIRWVNKVEAMAIPVAREVQNVFASVTEQLRSTKVQKDEGSEDYSLIRAELMQICEQNAGGLNELISERIQFLNSTDPGPTEQLGAMISHWCDDTYKILDSHSSIDRQAILSSMFNVNELCKDATELVEPDTKRVRSLLDVLKQLQAVIQKWIRDQDSPQAKLVNDRAWSTFLDRWDEISEQCARTIDLIPSCEQAARPLQVDTKQWSFTSMEWVIQLRAAESIATGTLEGQVRKVKALFTEWSVLVDLCMTGATEGHPDIVEAKYVRLWALLSNMTGEIEDCANANTDWSTTAAETESSELSCAKIFERILQPADLVSLRDEATDFNEKATVLMQSVRSDYRAPSVTTKDAHLDKGKKSKDDMLIPADDGQLFSISIPSSTELQHILTTLREPLPDSMAQDRGKDAAVKLVARAEMRLEGLRKLVQSLLMKHMPEDEYAAIPIWQQLAKDPPL